jgi:O-antigen/teichoic acid export membrane protein
MPSSTSSSSPAAGTGGKLRWGFLFNLLGRGAVVVSGAAGSLLLARHYGAETFGRWSVATAYATLVGTLLDGGFHRLMMRDVGRAPDAAKQVLWNVVKRRVQIAAGAVPLALAIATFTLGNTSTWLLVSLLVVARVVWDIVGSFSSVLFAFEKFWLPNFVETVRRSLLLAVIVALIVADVDIIWVAVATLVLCVLGSGAIVTPAISLVADKTARLDGSRWTDATWFWLNGVLFWINAEVDQIMLSKLSGDEQTGIYAAGVRLISLWLIIPRAVNDTVIRRWFRARGRADSQMLVTTFLLAGVGSLIGSQIVMFPGEIIALVYSSKYDSAAAPFRILGWFLIFHFCRCAPHWFISTSDRVPLATFFLGVAAAGNFLVNLKLIPAHGALGAAYATAGSELLLVVLAYIASGKGALKLVSVATLGAIPLALAVPAALLLRGLAPWYVASVVSIGLGGVVLALAGRVVSTRWRAVG